MTYHNRRIYRLWRLLCFVLPLAIFGVNMAEAKPLSSERPKIGLVLGGGSAGGFAHIGVLKWLEENRIPIDYVAGTSMGGLMGGCYAMGMESHEIAALVQSIDWGSLFNADPPYDALNFRRKEDRRDYPDFEVGFKNNRLALPGGLSLYKVDLILSRITLPYAMIPHFDALPIPFRCVATDIVQSEPVVFENGLLREALRSTMAIPGVFTPVEYGAKLLVDGGVLDNLPVDVARGMGADRVIAVNITTSSKPSNVKGLDVVVGRTIDTVVKSNAQRSIKMADVVVEPQLDDLGLQSWQKADRYIALGYQAAQKQAAALRRYAVDPSTWESYLAHKRGNRVIQVPVLQVLKVEGASDINQKVISRTLQPYLNQPIDTKGLERAFTSLMGSGLYESFSYRYGYENGRPALLVDVHEKRYGPPFMSFSHTLTNDANNEAIGFGTRLTMLNLVGPHSELRTDLNIGNDGVNFLTELYRPIADSQWFLSGMAGLSQEKSKWYQSGREINNYKNTEQLFGGDIGYTFNDFAEGRLGYFVGHRRTDVTVGQPFAADFDGFFRMARFKWSFISSEAALLPHRILRNDLIGTCYLDLPGATTRIGTMENKFLMTIPTSSKDFVMVRLDAGCAFNGGVPFPQQFKLGGAFRLGARIKDELYGDNYLFGSVGYFKNIGRLLKKKDIYAGLWLESGGVFSDGSDPDLDLDVATGVISPSMFGPIYINFYFDQDANTRFNFGVGVPF